MYYALHIPTFLVFVLFLPACVGVPLVVVPFCRVARMHHTPGGATACASPQQSQPQDDKRPPRLAALERPRVEINAKTPAGVQQQQQQHLCLLPLGYNNSYPCLPRGTKMPPHFYRGAQLVTDNNSRSSSTTAQDWRRGVPWQQFLPSTLH